MAQQSPSNGNLQKLGDRSNMHKALSLGQMFDAGAGHRMQDQQSGKGNGQELHTSANSPLQ
jgi:hypothetical protein